MFCVPCKTLTQPGFGRLLLLTELHALEAVIVIKSSRKTGWFDAEAIRKGKQWWDMIQAAPGCFQIPPNQHKWQFNVISLVLKAGIIATALEVTHGEPLGFQ